LPSRAAPHQGEERRVMRGGAWNSHAPQCRAACRGSDVPGRRVNTVGMRVAFSVN